MSKICKGIAAKHAASIKNTITVLHALAEWSIDEFLEKSSIAKYDPNEPIMFQGTYGDQVYFLFSGSVKVIVDGKVIINLARSGDVFGEMGALAGAARSATIEAGENGTVCLVCDMGSINSLKDPEQRTALLKILSAALADKLKINNNLIANAKARIQELEIEKRNLAEDKKVLRVALRDRFIEDKPDETDYKIFHK
jgi:CRP-like cAMP-binding protein